ncbi:MAG: ATP-binding protein [Actinomycetota bacterium]|nr:ATP-binding protein [Actinomycetota bacterium]
MTSTADILRRLPYFEGLSDDLLEKVCGGSEQLEIDQDTVIIEEGSESEEMYVLVEGELVVTKRGADKEVELARISPGNVVGETALLAQAPRTATVSSSAKSLVVKIPVSAFEDLLGDPRVVRRMFHTVTSRLRDTEETLRHEERMAALGRMAAQLMHELNNPAAAVGRSTQELRRVYDELGSEAAVLTRSLGDGADLPSPEPPEKMSSLERSDAEDVIAEWLDGLDIADAWELAPSLVDAGWTSELLGSVVDDMSPDIAPHFARWLALTTMAEQVLGEVTIGAKRISELVRIVKEYSYLDQAPIQEIVPTEGIEDTLVLLKYKLGDIEVLTDFPDDLAKVEAPGRDLNQVWTNLIDNAADAMPDGGTLRISARNEPDAVVIEVADNGEGMPDDVANRIFDPFFTTKEPGKGTGLGLHTVHTIIGRVGGEITVSSSESGTTFTIKLPLGQA